jgi:hypothetical protein
MIKHRSQHPDDRTTPEAGRAPRLINKNPVTDAVIRQAQYLSALAGAPVDADPEEEKYTGGGGGSLHAGSASGVGHTQGGLSDIGFSDFTGDDTLTRVIEGGFNE